MVLTRWSSNDGTLVTPQDATIFSGSQTFPVTSATLDVNVHTLIDADLGGFFVLATNRILVTVSWRVILTLTIGALSSKSIYQSNPPRRKLGVMTYAQGLYSLYSEPINYTACILQQQRFLFLERTSEPSLSLMPTPTVPEPRDFILTPTSGDNPLANTDVLNFGCTRMQGYFEPGIVGIAEVSYVARRGFNGIADFGTSFLVSQL